MSQKEERTPPEVYLAEAAKFRRRAGYAGGIVADVVMTAVAIERALNEAEVASIQRSVRQCASVARLALLLEEAALFQIAPPAPREFGPALLRVLNLAEEAASTTVELKPLREALNDFAREDALARLREDR